MKRLSEGNGEAEKTAQGLEQWLESLEKWFADIAANSHYESRVHCYFEKQEQAANLMFAIVLTPTPAESESTAAPSAPVVAAVENALLKPMGDRSPTNVRPKVESLLPTRSEARGKIVVRRPARGVEPESESGSQAKTSQSFATPTLEFKRAAATVKDPKHAASRHFDIDNERDVQKSAFGPIIPILNEDLLKQLVLEPPPPSSETALVWLAASVAPDLYRQEAGLQTFAGHCGILLRAMLVEKVASSKGNLALYINRLEALRALFIEAEQLKTGKRHKARLVLSLWRLLENMREASPVVPKTLQQLPAELKARSKTALWCPSDLGNLAWYHWNVSLPSFVSRQAGRLTRLGHVLAVGAFISLLLLSLHPGLAPEGGGLAQWLGHIAAWRTRMLPDGATLAVIFAVCASAVYALTAKRLSMPERVALSINDKIETVLDRTVADLMKANMDVQIGRLGRGEPPGLIPEGVARKLDEAFALKELVNSFESTVRARQRHVALEVRKAQNIRLESHQRVRNAALGVTASFVLLEIGSRIQDHRDLQAGTDTFSFTYWLHRTQPEAKVSDSAPALSPPVVMLDCARSELTQQQTPSPACLEQWRESALASSSQLLFFVFLIALLMFVVRVMRRGSHSDAS